MTFPTAIGFDSSARQRLRATTTAVTVIGLLVAMARGRARGW
jgi:hypothetical protein